MSLWSIIAVDHLEINRDSKILDVCCAPGMKLIYSGLLLRATESNHTVTGIDISERRLSITRALVKKYKVPSVRLLVGDSGTITSAPIEQVPLTDLLTNKELCCRCTMPDLLGASKVYYTSTHLRRIGHIHSPGTKYNRILVDPECSQTSTVKYTEKQLGPNKNYREEQVRILKQSIDMLEEGGIIIYSTCTFEPEENEMVISEVLKECPHIRRVDISTDTLAKYRVQSENIKTEETAKLMLGDSLFIVKLKYDKHS